jgi:NAD(P)-dependent dehydrogenase (short-subunit alcohol dehydrogenase family)
MSNPIRFDGQVAIVTGAGGSMGRAYAMELAKRGAAVLVNDYGGDVHGNPNGSAGPAEAVAAEIHATGGRAVANGNAVGTGDSARAIVAAAIEAFGRLDILVNNCGTALPGAFTDFDDATIEQHYRINVIGGHHLMRAAWPIMSAQRHGRVLNVSSNGVMGVGGNAPYGAAKAAMLGLTFDTAIEGRARNILVNAVMPTAYSRMIEQIPDRATVGWFQRNLPAQKVAAAMAFFLSHQSDVTGRVFYTGGGRLGTTQLAENDGIFVRDIDAETVRDKLADVLGTDRLTVTPDQASAGKRYMEALPWDADSAPNFQPNLDEA